MTSPTELTTAATDLILGFLALFCACWLLTLRRFDRWKAGTWATLFIWLFLASILGAIVHGLELPTTYDAFFASIALKNLHGGIWAVLDLTLGFTIAYFLVGAFYDFAGLRASKIALFILLPLALVFVGAKLTLQALGYNFGFLLFILYEGLAMIIALILYVILLFQKRPRGGFFVLLGILVTILAAVLQTIRSIAFTMIWEFNFNGVFHLTQMVGVILLLIGIHRSLTGQSGRQGEASIA